MMNIDFNRFLSYNMYINNERVIEMNNEKNFYDIYADAEQKYVKNNLKAIRTSRNMSQQVLADLTGMKQTFILKLEKGQANFTAANLIKCARVLECSLSDILNVALPEHEFVDKAVAENIELKKKIQDIYKIID